MADSIEVHRLRRVMERAEEVKETSKEEGFVYEQIDAEGNTINQ